MNGFIEANLRSKKICVQMLYKIIMQQTLKITELQNAIL